MKWSSSRAKQRNIIINIIKGTSVARASLPEQLIVHTAPNGAQYLFNLHSTDISLLTELFNEA
ncbi:hypothetical protein DRQ09_02605 [candidate division KSB1 bacterium]|nr:MAG: hypothetical protein DRQ09_02605 [candidate division KSB1 bacterium]